MAAFHKFHAFVEDVARQVHNLNADTLKVLLVNRAPVAGDSVKADLVEIGAGNGYEAGGNVAAFRAGGQIAGKYTLVLSSPTHWKASGGTIGPFRYPVLYNASSPAGPLIGWWDYDESITLKIGEEFAVDLDPVDGVLTLG